MHPGGDSMYQQGDELDHHNNGIDNQEGNREEIGVKDGQLFTLEEKSHHDDQP